jgi:hypothetical protein
MSLPKLFVKKMVRPGAVKKGAVIQFQNEMQGTVEYITKGNADARYDWKFDIMIPADTEVWLFYLYCGNDEYIEISYPIN